GRSPQPNLRRESPRRADDRLEDRSAPHRRAHRRSRVARRRAGRDAFPCGDGAGPRDPASVTPRWRPYLDIQTVQSRGFFERGIPIVCQVYDLIPDVTGMLQPGSDGERFHRVRNRVLTDADFLIALSEQTRSDVIEHLQVDPDRIAVVGAATSDFFRPPEPGERPRELLAHELPRVTRPFLLTVSAWLPHKNTELLLEAFARLRPD